MTALAQIAHDARAAAAEADAAAQGRGACGNPAGEAMRRASELAEFALRFDPDDWEDVEALRNLARCVQQRGTLRESGCK